MVHAIHEQEWLERSGRAWSERAEAWDAMSGANAMSADRAAEIERWQTGLQLSNETRLLDAGCGSGQFAIAFARLGCDVTGIDLSPEMIARAISNASTADGSVSFIVGPLAPLPFPDGTYDALFCRMVLHLVPDPWQVLQELRRVLSPSGRLYVSVPGALSPIYSQRWRRHLEIGDTPVNGMLPWELESLLQELGWSVNDSWGDWSGQGESDAALAGEVARGTGNDLLLQATATTWGFIAS